MKHLSIIILTYNSENDIYDCLKSVYQYNDIGERLEIIVVDNQSRNFAVMQQKIATLYPNIVITQNTHNGGYGQGNNVGIKLAQAPIIAVMNPDVRLIMPVFAEMIDRVQQEDVVMCAGKQYGGDGSLYASFFSLFTVPWWFGRPLEYFSRRVIDTYFYRLQYLSGAFFIMRKDIMEDIGMFDENIFMYAEENDIHHRIRKMFPNMKMKYLNHLAYIHLAENRPFSSKHVKQVYISNGYFFTKNGKNPVKYWRQQMRMNIFLDLFYSLRNIVRNNHQDIVHLKERNQILRTLIEEYKLH